MFSLGISTPARLGFALSSAAFFFFSFFAVGSAGFRFRPGPFAGVTVPFLCPLFPFLVGEGVVADLDPLRVRFAGGSSSSSSAPSSLSDPTNNMPIIKKQRLGIHLQCQDQSTGLCN